MHGYMERVARGFALLGGAVLTSLILLVCLSVLGRSANSVLHSDVMQTYLPWLSSTLLAAGVGPITGDFELVEVGMAFVIFAFLPLCHLRSAHASVDIFTSRFPKRAALLLRTLIEVVFAMIIIVIAWQLFQGLLSKMNSGQTTFLLQFPVWWGYALSQTAAVAAVVIAVYVAAMHVLELVTGQRRLPVEAGAEH